jgi:hypothetical protein
MRSNIGRFAAARCSSLLSRGGRLAFPSRAEQSSSRLGGAVEDVVTRVEAALARKREHALVRREIERRRLAELHDQARLVLECDGRGLARQLLVLTGVARLGQVDAVGRARGMKERVAAGRNQRDGGAARRDRDVDWQGRGGQRARERRRTRERAVGRAVQRGEGAVRDGRRSGVAAVVAGMVAAGAVCARLVDADGRGRRAIPPRPGPTSDRGPRYSPFCTISETT